MFVLTFEQTTFVLPSIKMTQVLTSVKKECKNNFCTNPTIRASIYKLAHFLNSVNDMNESLLMVFFQVNALIEESCFAAGRGEIKLALDRAKEASTKERSLIRYFVLRLNNKRHQNGK